MGNTDKQQKIIAQAFYIINYYDLPLEGLAIHDNSIVYFSVRNEDIHEDREPRYSLYSLSDEEVRVELAEKEMFDEMVGTHWSLDYAPEERRVKGVNSTFYGNNKEEIEAKRIASRSRRDKYTNEANIISDESELVWSRYGKKIELPSK